MNDYHFVTTWRVQGTCGEVADVLSDPLRLAVWWPSVYLKVEELEPAKAENGIGRRVRLLTKGWLPYTLCWDLVVLDSTYPHRITIAAARTECRNAAQCCARPPAAQPARRSHPITNPLPASSGETHLRDVRAASNPDRPRSGPCAARRGRPRLSLPECPTTGRSRRVGP